MDETPFEWDGGFLLDCLSRLRFRLKAAARHRLAIDISVLSTGLRAAVMIDYAFGVPQLQTQLCRLLHLLAQFTVISSLRVMRIDEVLYLIHVKNLTLQMDGTLDRSTEVDFAILDDTVVRVSCFLHVFLMCATNMRNGAFLNLKWSYANICLPC
ncbi:hypothetical protein KP509_11G012500 [Ceratopteris richardii]|uniref:Uncharacterized protein n=1 Tax=Ceratopteris richardii TaxID=49495 RepID=A0A8T2TM45_CERRI|nr:hypothetical protein KP509_11G012500 [Ceratopteris richardii]